MNADRKRHARFALVGLALTALVATPAVLSSTGPSVAQSATSLPIVGIYVRGSQEDPRNVNEITAFVQGMKELGYHEGANVHFESRFADSNAANAAELVALGPDVIVVSVGNALEWVAAETSTIPIVGAYAGGGLRDLVQNHEQPEGNITGRIPLFQSYGTDIVLAHEMIPGATRWGYVLSEDDADAKRLVDEAAAALGLTVVYAVATTEAEVLPAYQAVIADGAAAVLLDFGGQFIATGAQIVEAAQAAQMPTIFQQHQYDAFPPGGLMSMGGNSFALMHIASYMVDRLLRGATPADLPIVRSPGPVSIRVNLAAARELGLTIPESIVARATEVFEVRPAVELGNGT